MPKRSALTQALADERRVDGEGAGFVEAGAATELGDGVEEGHEAARGRTAAAW